MQFQNVAFILVLTMIFVVGFITIKMQTQHNKERERILKENIKKLDAIIAENKPNKDDATN